MPASRKQSSDASLPDRHQGRRHDRSRSCMSMCGSHECQGQTQSLTSAFIGAAIGFLWYNSFPAQVFMGDTGSLAIGAIIAVLALAVRKEFLLPIIAGVFLAENLSVIIQVSYFKYTKKKYGEGRRVFLMSPLHHHYQKKGYPETKIVTRFWIVGIMLAVAAIATLKLR